MKLLSLRHEMTLDALGFGTAAAPLLHHYRTAPRISGMSERIHLELLLCPVGDTDFVWASVPGDGRVGFLKAMTRVSVEIQRALRAWVQFLWFSDLANLQDTERTAQVAAYLALRPFYPKVKCSYSYDLLEDRHTESIERSVGIYIGDVLQQLSTQLRLAGEHDLADYYAPDRSDWFAQEALKSRKGLYEMISRESQMIRAWAPLLGNAPDVEFLAAAREQASPALRGIFRRDDDWKFLTPMLELEVLAGLETFLHKPKSRQLELRIRPADRPVANTKGKLIEFPRRTPVDLAA